MQYTYKIVDGAYADKAVIESVCKNAINKDYINQIAPGVQVGVLGLNDVVIGIVAYTIHEGWAIIHLFCAPGHGKALQRGIELSKVASRFALGSIKETKVIAAYQNLGYSVTFNDLQFFYTYLGSNEVIMTKVIGGGRRSHLKLPLKVRKTRRQRRLIPQNPARKRTRRVRS